MCSKALGIEEFDDELFYKKVEKIISDGQQGIQIIFKDGTKTKETRSSTAKKDWWTPERRKSWSE